jgi:carbamoyl-phosphate synthase large subunit
MKDLNTLITSASRKVWLIERFRQAYKKEDMRGKIIAIDISRLNPAMHLADKNYIVPRLDDEHFLETVLDICKKENIKLIIPTRDADVLFFAKNRKTFESLDILVPVSTEEVVRICNDKIEFFEFCNKNDIKTPSTQLGKGINFVSVDLPVVIKPREGAGSISTFIVRNEEDLHLFLKRIEDPIIQEFIEGDEYTIDAFIDMSGNIIFIIPRRRLQVVSGESYKGKTVRDEHLIEKTTKLIEKLGCVGHVTIQCIKKDNEFYFFDLNPRFGGGASLGIEAGGNSPYFLLQMMAGKKIESIVGKYKNNLYMLRYTKDLFLVDENDKSYNI